MATTQDYINQLKRDKENLVSMLNNMGVEASNNETFTSLTPKVGKIVSDPILQDKSIEITENGTTNIKADEGYNGLNEVDVTVNIEGKEDLTEELTTYDEELIIQEQKITDIIEILKTKTTITEPVLQDKTITITENGTTNIVADEGFDGLNKVDVTVNVENKEEPPVTPDYITNGLVAWFDGEDKPHDSKYWISRVGVDYISDVNGKTLLSDEKSFKNNKTLAMITSADYYKKDYTIEIVGKLNSQVNSDNSTGAWFLTMNEAGTWGIGVKNATGDVTFVNHTVNMGKTFSGYLKRTFSSSLFLETVYSRGHTSGKNTGKGSVNGCEWFSIVEPTASGVGTKLQNHAILCYYARTSGTTEKVDGEINCIRIYNRQLTNEELLHNYNIDKTRFNIEEV